MKKSDYVYFKFPKDINQRLKDLKTKNPDYWENLARKKVIEFVNFTIKNVPAYRKFLLRNNIKLSSLHNIDEFNQLPFTNKKNYLRYFSFNQLIPNNFRDKITTFSSTSGSTGEPFYIPRGENEDSQYEYIAELFLKNQFSLDNKRTLAINGFGLGIWIGGIFTHKAFNKISSKGYPLALAPVGVNKETFLKTFTRLAENFDQIILMGYPPFIKDILDEGPEYDINWKRFNLRIVTAAEGFSETFRDYLVKKTNINNRFNDIINIYGSVELGTMAHETPLTNLIRKKAVENKNVFKKLFPETNLQPTLAQFHPYLTFFEEQRGEIFATGFGSLYPLVRYQFFDKGGVIAFDKMLYHLKELGIDILEEAKKERINTIQKLPFVYVCERSDLVVHLYGINIFPEFIKTALMNPGLEKIVTGKFTMEKTEGKDLEEILNLHVELRKGIKHKKIHIYLIQKYIVENLINCSTEYRHLSQTNGDKIKPNIALHSYQDQHYFGSSIKQRWIKK